LFEDPDWVDAFKERRPGGPKTGAVVAMDPNLEMVERLADGKPHALPVAGTKPLGAGRRHANAKPVEADVVQTRAR